MPVGKVPNIQDGLVRIYSKENCETPRIHRTGD